MKTLTLLLIILPVLLMSQQHVQPNFDTITVNYEFYEAPYLHKSVSTDTSREDYRYSGAGNYLSFAGHAREATALMESRSRTMGMDTARYQRFMSEFQPVDAKKELIAVAKNHEIVIINESHHEPRHRVFTRSLLQGLYDIGYRHFGLETLSDPRYVKVDSMLKAGQPLALSHGYYTREPQFAAMVTEAVEIGFSVFGYESAGSGSPKMRELGQMRNIMRYRDAHPDGKLLLHVGYSHANEGNIGGRWEKAMAQRLADTTGLNPMTINQTSFREMSTEAQERFEYKRRPVNNSSVFVDITGNSWQYGDGTEWFDYYVFHPRTQYRYGRPDYVYACGQQPIYVDMSGMDVDGPYLIQAYREDWKVAAAVPVDIIEVGESQDRALALLPGRYRLLIEAIAGEQRTTNIEVK